MVVAVVEVLLHESGAKEDARPKQIK